MHFGPGPCSQQILKVLLHSPGSNFFHNCPKIWDLKKIFKLINVLCLLPQRMQTLPTLVCLVEVGFE